MCVIVSLCVCREQNLIKRLTYLLICCFPALPYTDVVESETDLPGFCETNAVIRSLLLYVVAVAAAAAAVQSYWSSILFSISILITALV